MAKKAVNESRAAKLAKGFAQKAWLLPPEALRDLAAITKREGCNETEAVVRALAALASPTDEPSNRELIRLLGARLKVRS